MHDARASVARASSASRPTTTTRCARTRSRAAIAADRAAGLRPIAIVATVGTTSSTSVDPVAAIADVAEREGLWLHVDAAYAGAVALAPRAARRRSAGWERADSIVVNPHKWLFTPLDASLLLTRRMDDLRAAFSLVPEYLRTLDRDDARAATTTSTRRSSGRRFRALKLWMLLRWFGLEGLRRRIAHHLELAQAFAAWVDARRRLGAARTGAVLDGLLSLSAGRASPGARTSPTSRGRSTS